MRKFLTEYFQGDERYSSHIYAKSYHAANRLAIIRNIGEAIIGEDIDYKYIAKEPETIVEALHEACFLSYLVLKSGKLGIDEILGDRGILHEMAHLLHLSDKRIGAQEFYGQLAHLRSIIPGYEPV